MSKQISHQRILSAVSKALPGIESRHLLSEAIYSLKIKHFDPNDDKLEAKILDYTNQILTERMLNYDELLIFGYSRRNTNDLIPTDIMKHIFKFYGTELDWDTEEEEE